MGCNSCKSNKNVDLSNFKSESNESVVANGNNYIFKFFIFLIASCLLVLSLPLLFIMLFKTIVLDNSINLMPLLLKIANIFKIEKKEDNEEIEINPEELELVGIDKIEKQ